MRAQDLDYELPPQRVAQVPADRREDARLLVLGRRFGSPRHGVVSDLPALLAPGDLLVVNDTRVLPARLHARRATGGAVEVLLVEAAAAPPGAWHALVRSGGSLGAGEVLTLASGEGVRLLADEGSGRWLVAGDGADLATLMERHGRMPLPPYIRRRPDDARSALDRERYQTTFARADGAIAAPTAGLHLTPPLLDAMRARGIDVRTVTLHVGLGTFEPVRTERLEDHAMHEEAWAVPPDTAEAWRRTRAGGGRVVAVGTTVVRTLEASALAARGVVTAGTGRTRLLILPGYAFHAVDALLTNFHRPRSTLLALVCAFADRDRVLAAYAEAIRAGYRFHSYGDAMLVL